MQATTSEKKVQLKFIHYRFRAEQVTINKRVMINQTDVVYQGSNYIKTIRYRNTKQAAFILSDGGQEWKHV